MTVKAYLTPGSLRTDVTRRIRATGEVCQAGLRRRGPAPVLNMGFTFRVYAYGETDEWSFRAVKDLACSYDMHATVLHLLGIDRCRITVCLTNVHGEVI